jgi:trans-aconitate 3-methyltransferase
VWNEDRKYHQTTKDEDFGTAKSISPEEFERFLGTHSPVARWREAHCDLAGTENDVVKSVRKKIEGLLHVAGVEPGKEILRGGVAIVLLMVKKI